MGASQRRGARQTSTALSDHGTCEDNDDGRVGDFRSTKDPEEGIVMESKGKELQGRSDNCQKQP